ncbi:MAG: aminomethyl transferase family protein [Candidatus Tectomicrobia bacterium]|uniref:Aminomethyl transferase family protein n=1 Tax=Tectimicrobiota bacterium TaxID=2528274 RepID=A0A932GPL1_UNCTE|nr:aminomethyl transferase family protein [Candidatus Tectomicrobia bacterium]
MSQLDIQKFREEYRRSLEWDRPFYFERPAVFSPAAAAQENHGACNIMWKFISEWIPWQYTNFIEEGLSFHETAYLGDWSALTKFRIKGPDALEFLSYYCVNNLHKFNLGQIKHAIQTNEQGKVAGEGILYKISEEEYRYSGGGAYWLSYWFQQAKRNAEARIDSPDEFVFVIQGPKSLYVMEKTTRENLRDIKFSYTRMTKIGQHDVRILRTGVTGELGYEVHGPSEIGNDIWVAIHEAGKEFGLRLLGGRSQLISHVEGCFPTIGRDFWPAASTTGGSSKAHKLDTKGGSYEWSDPSELMRSPFELGWDKEVSLDTHDFMGREALIVEKNAGGPARRIVGLKWNSEDVIDVYAALFRAGPIPTPMELPRVNHKHSLDPDKVLKDGNVVGCSTSRVYSPYFRQMISLCVIDKDFAEPGMDVTVVWGDRGGPQREIRATVTKVPFKEDKRRIDVAKL